MNIRLHRLAVIAAVAAPAISGLTVAQTALAAAPACSVPSLTAAIKTANGVAGGATVTLPSKCVYVLKKTDNTADGGTGLPVITGKITLVGSGSTIRRSSTSGTPAFRIFDVASGGSLRMSALTLSNGRADNGAQGGGAIFSRGTLSVTGSTFTDNFSPSATGTSGGAIDSSGALTVTTSTFAGNSAQEGGGILSQLTATVKNSTFTRNKATIFGGGGIVIGAGTLTAIADTFTGNSGPGGGAIDNDATLTVSDSTFFGNTAGSNGGGAIVNFGTATIRQSTLSGNTAPFGANLLNFTGFSLAISTSIVAGGFGGTNCGGQAPITDGGYNIDTGSSCGFSAASHSRSTTQPRLDALASNGGPTQTMALPSGSPAINAIPSNTTGCAGSADQRGIARPQGKSCDIGAYERIVTSGDIKRPTKPKGLAVTTVTAHAVSLRWTKSKDNVGVTGYTIYRNGTSVGSTGGAAATTFTDVKAAPSTAYRYRVAAFDGSGNHSARSATVSVTTHKPGGVKFVQGGAVSGATTATSTTITLAGPVQAEDLLAGWFGQFSSAGQVKVSDNVNGAWIRSSASTTFSSGNGDIAMFYRPNSKPAPWGLTITITAASPTFLQGAVSEYSGVATTASLAQVAVGHGTSTTAASGATGATTVGELLFSGLMTGASPGTATVGGGLALREHTANSSADDADRTVRTAGPQNVTWTLQNPADWYEVAAVFRAAR